MAFRVIKKKKRQAAPSASDILDLDVGTGESGSGAAESSQSGAAASSVPASSVSIPAQQTAVPSYMNPQKKNVAATQAWVFRMMKSIWNWTRHFGTQSLAVAGPINSALLTTGEVQTDDLYTRRLILLDQDGRPCEIYIDKTGHIVVKYEYKNVYVYPYGVQARKFLYRWPDIVQNFVNLTPAETLVNFVQFPIEGSVTKEFNGQICPKLCPADSEDKDVEHTLLFTCPQTKKIVGLTVMDSDGNRIHSIDINAPSGMTVRKLTINLPCFRYNVQDGQSEDEMDLRYVQLPLTNPWDKQESADEPPFLPPFLAPPPPVICPMMPIPPPVPPPLPDMDEDIFDNEPLDDDIFEDVDASAMKKIVPGGDPHHKNYYTPTYVNVNLKRSEFEGNVEQYLKVELEDA